MLTPESARFLLPASLPAAVSIAANSASATVRELFSSSVSASPLPSRSKPKQPLAGAIPLTSALVFHRVALRDG
jgi:hypothetical protein